MGFMWVFCRGILAGGDGTGDGGNSTIRASTVSGAAFSIGPCANRAAHIQMITAQQTVAATSVHGNIPVSFWRRVIPSDKLLVMLDGDQEVFDPGLAGMQHGLHHHPLGRIRIGRYDDRLAWDACGLEYSSQ